VTTPKVSLPAANLCDLWIDSPAACEAASAVELTASRWLDEDVHPSVWMDGRALRHAIQSLLN
jgi:hypothetical protein